MADLLNNNINSGGGLPIANFPDATLFNNGFNTSQQLTNESYGLILNLLTSRLNLLIFNGLVQDEKGQKTTETFYFKGCSLSDSLLYEIGLVKAQISDEMDN